MLSIRTILFYAACACLAATDEHKRKEEAKKARQARLDRKTSLSFEAPPNAPSPAPGGTSPRAAPTAASAGKAAATEEGAAAAGGPISLAPGEAVAEALMLVP